MREPQHLSDEAVAAFADDVLTGHARERARRHTAGCPECNYAVAVQREAVWALRAAPAPSLPSGLLDRLRDVPATTPIQHVPTHVDEHGTTMFPTFGAAAAFVPHQVAQRAAKDHDKHERRFRRGHPMAMTVAGLAVLGALAGSAAAGSAQAPAAGKSEHAHFTSAEVPLRPW